MISERSQRTSGTFPYKVNQIGDMPASLQPAAAAALPPDARASFIFVAPPNVYPRPHHGMQLVPVQALLFTDEGVLHVQAADSKSEPRATYFRAEDLLYAQSGLLILYGRLELAGLVDGKLTRSVAEYNTVGWDLLKPSLQRLVWLATGGNRPSAAADSADRRLYAALGSLPYKFRSVLDSDVIQPGEVLRALAFQPAVWGLRLGVFRRQVTPRTALTISDRCAAIVEETPAVAGRRGEYGWTISYMPLTAIMDVESAAKGGWQEVTIRMQRGAAQAERRLILEDGPARAWRDLWAVYAPTSNRRPQSVEA